MQLLACKQPFLSTNNFRDQIRKYHPILSVFYARGRLRVTNGRGKRPCGSREQNLAMSGGSGYSLMDIEEQLISVTLKPRRKCHIVLLCLQSLILRSKCLYRNLCQRGLNSEFAGQILPLDWSCFGQMVCFFNSFRHCT